MALDFPNAPTDGLVYTAPTGEQWVYEAATNSWTSKGLVNSGGGIKYIGTIDIAAAPPTGAASGSLYTVLANGTANAGFGPGVTGALTKGDSILYTGSGWIKLSHPTAAWVVNGTVISPATVGDTAQISAGTAALPGLAVVGDPNTGLYSPGADQLEISTGGTGRVFVDAGGKVGIGTSSPQVRLQILAAGGPPSISANDGIAVIGASGGNQLAIGCSASSPFALWLQTKDADNTSGPYPLLLNPVRGNVGIGTATPSTLLEIKGSGYLRLAAGTGGIQFGGDTAAANALNDYEEGTWTPAYTSGTNTWSYTKQVGTYTKVGRTVVAHFSITATMTANPNLNLKVDVNLPFAAASEDTISGSCRFGAFGIKAIFHGAPGYFYWLSDGSAYDGNGFANTTNWPASTDVAHRGFIVYSV